MKPLLIAIQGPTASGKTKVAIELARWQETSIVSCDSRQFFKELKIGSAPPNAEELKLASHHFIQNLSIEDEYNAGMYEREALSTLADIFKSKKTAILVGGSGLYANAILEGFDDLPQANPEIRKELNEALEKSGLESLQVELSKRDPEYYEVVDKENPHRVIRALEVIRQSGTPISELRKRNLKKRNFEHISFVMSLPREELYARINKRVDEMMSAGLEQEARTLLPFRNKQTLNTVGYKELFQYFDEEIDLERAVELIKQNTRRFAKRQLTWYRRNKDSIWINPDNIEEMKKLIIDKMKSKKQ